MGLYAFLAHATPLAGARSRADALFVFAGNQERKVVGAEVWRQGSAPILVLSVGRFEWRRYASLHLPGEHALLAAVERMPPSERHFFVILEGPKAAIRPIRIERFGTRNEARALSELARERGWRSVLLLSSGFHLRRVAMAARRAFRGTEIALSYMSVPTTVDPYGANRWWRTRRGIRLILRELAKVVLYASFRS